MDNMAITRADIRTRVLTDKLDDESYDTATVNRFINDAQRAIYNRVELPFQEKVFVGLLPADEYVIQFPEDYQVAQSLVIRTPDGQNVDITDQYVPFRDFNQRFPAPQLNESRTPSTWTAYGGNMYFSNPFDNDYTLSMFYTRTAPYLANDADEIGLPDEFEEVLVLGTYYRVLQRNEDYDLAAAVKQEYREEMSLMIPRLAMRQRNKPMTIGQPRRRVIRRR